MIRCLCRKDAELSGGVEDRMGSEKRVPATIKAMGTDMSMELQRR